jgi:hypothetical protein
MKKYRSLIIWAIVGILPLVVAYAYKTFVHYCGESPAGFAGGCVEPDNLFLLVGYIWLFAVLVVFTVQLLVRNNISKPGHK